MPTIIHPCLRLASILAASTIIVSCTTYYTKSIPGGRFETRKDKGIPANPALGLQGLPGTGEDELYFIPSDGRLAMEKNVRQYLEANKASRMICTFAGTHTTGKRTADGKIDMANMRTASVVQHAEHGPLDQFAMNRVSEHSALINGIKSNEIALVLPQVSWASLKVFTDEGRAAIIEGADSAAEALPLGKKWSAREGPATLTLTPDAVEVYHPITKQRCMATQIRFAWRNGPGNPVVEEILLRDDVPGRIISISQEIRSRFNNQILTSTYLGLSKVEYR